MRKTSVIAALSVALVFGACGGSEPQASRGSADSDQTDFDTEAAAYETVRIVPVAADARAALPDALVSLYAHYFEAILRSRADGAYYIGNKAEMTEEYLTVRVPAGEYDVLVLGGRKAFHNLLATGFVSGVAVERMKANTLTVPLTAANIQTGEVTELGGAADPAEASDFFFYAAETPDGKKYGATAYDGVSGRLTYTFAAPSHWQYARLRTNKLKDLAAAEPAASGKPITFAENRAVLSQRLGDEAGSMVPALKGADGKFYGQGAFEPPTITYDPSTETYTAAYRYDRRNLRAQDVNLRATLELEYYAFGDEDSGSSRWKLAPGLDYTADEAGNAGGGVILRRDVERMTLDAQLDYIEANAVDGGDYTPVAWRDETIAARP